jgi:hypothetical protein
MSRMARIQEGEDVVTLSSRERLHVEFNKVVMACLPLVELFKHVT